MRAPLGIIAVLLFAVDCSGVSRREETLTETVAQAKDILKKLRPDADLDGTAVRLVRSRTDWASLMKEERRILDGRSILAAQTPVLLQLRLVSAADARSVQRAYGSLNPMVDADGLAIPSKKLALIIPEQVGSLELVAHELGHLASHDAYGQGLVDRISLRTGRGTDPKWVDLDAALAHLGLAEGEAQLMAQAVVAYSEGGHQAVSAMWAKPARTQLGQELTGPASITKPDGRRIIIEAGETYYVTPDYLLQAIYFLAYEGSVATFHASHQQQDSLKQTISRTWREATWTTRSLLFPGSPGKPSSYAEVLRARGIPGAAGAARAGAFLVAMMLARTEAASMKDAQDLVADFEDDVILRNPTGGVLWIVQWASEASSKRFAALYRLVLPQASVATQGVRVIVMIGKVPERDVWLDRLLRQ